MTRAFQATKNRTPNMETRLAFLHGRGGKILDLFWDLEFKISRSAYNRATVDSEEERQYEERWRYASEKIKERKNG